jgi:hypothetical protein
MVEALSGNISNVHGRPFANRRQALQNLDFAGVILFTGNICYFGYVFHISWSAFFLNWLIRTTFNYTLLLFINLGFIYTLSSERVLSLLWYKRFLSRSTTRPDCSFFIKHLGEFAEAALLHHSEVEVKVARAKFLVVLTSAWA